MIFADVAQWQSAAFVKLRLRVQLPPSAVGFSQYSQLYLRLANTFFLTPLGTFGIILLFREDSLNQSMVIK